MSPDHAIWSSVSFVTLDWYGIVWLLRSDYWLLSSLAVPRVQLMCSINQLIHSLSDPHSDFRSTRIHSRSVPFIHI